MSIYVDEYFLRCMHSSIDGQYAYKVFLGEDNRRGQVSSGMLTLLQVDIRKEMRVDYAFCLKYAKFWNLWRCTFAG